MNDGRILSVALTLALCSCDSAPAPAGSSAPAATSAAPVSSASSAPSASGARVTASAAPTGPARHFVGATEMKKTKVKLPSGVKVTAWRTDEGTTLVGKVELDVVLAPDGTVTGTGKGALGDLVVTGAWDKEHVHAELAPKDPASENAVRGTLEGTVSDKGLTGTLRASSNDATLVREGTVELAAK